MAQVMFVHQFETYIYPEMALVSDACVPVWDTLIFYWADSDTHNTGLAPDHMQAAAFAFVSFHVG